MSNPELDEMDVFTLSCKIVECWQKCQFEYKGQCWKIFHEELEYPAGGDHPQHVSHNHGSKNGPAWQRRRTRRAAACEAGKAVSCAEKETGDEKVDDIAKKANSDESSITENVVEDLGDEFCSDEEYLKEIEETSELFKLTYKCLSQESPKSESETLEVLKRILAYTFNH